MKGRRPLTHWQTEGLGAYWEEEVRRPEPYHSENSSPGDVAREQEPERTENNEFSLRHTHFEVSVDHSSGWSARDDESRVLSATGHG